MTTGTHAERIMELLAREHRLDDDAIAQALSIMPRQTVNQVCRRLEKSGLLLRNRGPAGKIVNELIVGAAPATRTIVSIPSRHPELASIEPGQSLCPEDMSATLIVIPCSGKKLKEPGEDPEGTTILQSLPAALANELAQARRNVAARIFIDELTLMPAWRRYNGLLYQNAQEAIRDLMHAGAHIVILSAGYGAIAATEPIGLYNEVLKSSWWPNRVLQRVLVAYARHHGLRSVRAFCAATGSNQTILRRVCWRDAAIDDALLFTPTAGAGGLRKSPATQGEALAALRDGVLNASWRSSCGLGLDVRRGSY